MTGLDVNAVVSYNLRTIRQRQGWTQEGVAQRLGQLTGHELPQASISAMERGFDGSRVLIPRGSGKSFAEGCVEPSLQ